VVAVAAAEERPFDVDADVLTLFEKLEPHPV
jgi:hypothetical protein